MECAWAATHSKQPEQDFLRNKFYQLRSRMGHNKALIAVGHKILIAIYHMLNEKKPYQVNTPLQHQEKQVLKQKDNLLKKLQAIGYKAELTIIVNN